METLLQISFTEEKVQYSFVCVFLSEVAKGTREVTQNAQFILNGLTRTLFFNSLVAHGGLMFEGFPDFPSV